MMTKKETILRHFHSLLRSIIYSALAALVLTGHTPVHAQQKDYIAEVFPVALDFCPQQTDTADGRYVDGNTYPRLVDLIDTRFGPLQGVSAKLPDLRNTGHSVPRMPRWCIDMREGPALMPGPPDPSAQRQDVKGTSDILTTAAADCPPGWERLGETLRAIPNSVDAKLITACRAVGRPKEPLDPTNPDQYSTQGRLKIVEADACPENTLPADGRLLQISEWTAIYSLILTEYGGNGRTEFALPKLHPPEDGLIWCMVMEGFYPNRP